MNIHQLSPYIRYAGDSWVNPPWHLRERMLFDYELLYVKEGEVEVIVEKQKYLGSPGDLFLFKPRQRHSLNLLNGKRLNQPHVHFDLQYREDSPLVKISFLLQEEMSEEEKSWFREDECADALFLPNFMRLRSPIIFEKMLFDVIREYELGKPLHEAAAKGLFIQLWIYLLREWNGKNKNELLSKREQLVEVKNYLDHHIYSEISIDQLARLANLSKFYFLRTFKKTFGMSPVQYHLNMRMQKAKEMILFTDLSLTEIADRIGYSGIHAFSRAYKRMEKAPPSAIRRSREIFK